MRQRRQRLQVSTFPFLAVLLCAMGSLILLLLVIDRRAKIVARVKALRAREHALAQATAEEERAAAAHRAEWERRRQLLHEQLLQQDQQVRGELQAVQSRAAAATGRTQIELAHSRELQEQLQAEHSVLARFEDELTARRAEVASTARQADASHAELARLTADLERMEHTLADLKAIRQRQQQRYSLVPYRGKRGDNRKAIYIECSGDDLIFHADRLALHGLTLTPSAIRDEIERRLARQLSETIKGSDPLKPQALTSSSDAVNGKPEENAYLLMLIRPNGITTYYRTLAALKGLPIDFGYEFVDQDWVLDFSEDDNSPKTQPWMTVDRTKEKQPCGSSAKAVEASGPSVAGRSQRRFQGLPSAGTVTSLIPPSPPAGGGEGGVSGGRPVGMLATSSRGPDNPSLGSGGVGTSREGNFVAGTVGNPAAGVQPVAIPSGAGRSVLGTGDGNEPSFAKVLAGGSRSSAAGGNSLGGAQIMASRPPLGSGEPSSAPGGTAEGMDHGPPVVGGQRGTKDQSSDNQSAQSSGTAKPQTDGSLGAQSKAGIGAPPSVLPEYTPNRGTAAVNPGVDASHSPAREEADHSGPVQGRPTADEPVRGSAGDPLDQLAAQNPQHKPVRAVPLRPGLLIGNRDWIIPIECTADALVLHPSGQRIATAELSKGENGSNPLLETVQRLIARRQATVRAGEPLYRPMIRFRVWPDGLRSYYLAYPALEALHVPMSRENLDAEEGKAASRQR